jgi:chromosome segregation ATPase
VRCTQAATACVSESSALNSSRVFELEQAAVEAKSRLEEVLLELAREKSESAKAAAAAEAESVNQSKQIADLDAALSRASDRNSDLSEQLRVCVVNVIPLLSPIVFVILVIVRCFRSLVST